MILEKKVTDLTRSFHVTSLEAIKDHEKIYSVFNSKKRKIPYNELDTKIREISDMSSDLDNARQITNAIKDIKLNKKYIPIEYDKDKLNKHLETIQEKIGEHLNEALTYNDEGILTDSKDDRAAHWKSLEDEMKKLKAMQVYVYHQRYNSIDQRITMVKELLEKNVKNRRNEIRTQRPDLAEPFRQIGSILSSISLTKQNIDHYVSENWPNQDTQINPKSKQSVDKLVKNVRTYDTQTKTAEARCQDLLNRLDPYWNQKVTWEQLRLIDSKAHAQLLLLQQRAEEAQKRGNDGIADMIEVIGEESTRDAITNWYKETCDYIHNAINAYNPNSNLHKDEKNKYFTDARDKVKEFEEYLDNQGF